MTPIQNMMIGFSEIKDSSDIILSDSAQNLLNALKIHSINEIEFLNGYSFIADMLAVLSGINVALDAGNIFVEICLKSNKANIYFKDYSTTKYEDIYEYIEQTIHNSDITKNTRVSRRIIWGMKKCRKYILCLDYTLDKIGLLPTTIKVLNQNNIYLVTELIRHSRIDLLGMPKIGQATVEEIVDNLADNNIHLKDDNYYVCQECNNEFIGCCNGTDVICFDCAERINRLKKNNKFVIRLELEQATFKNDSKGFIIYADIKNKSRAIQTLSYKEAYFVSQGRQYSSNNFLSNYQWAEKEDIVPSSLKTLGLIWYDNYLKYENLIKNDELILVMYSHLECKTIFYKFVYKELDDTGDDYGFVLYDVITK